MKRFSAMLMLVILSSLGLVPIFPPDVLVKAILPFIPVFMLHVIICMWRQYRVRRRQGKRRPLGGYREFETELWDTMARIDQLWVGVYGCLVFSGSLALLLFQKLTPEIVAVLFPLSAFAALSYIFASYRDSKPTNVDNSPLVGANKALRRSREGSGL